MLTLGAITKADAGLRATMARHYSAPKGFVGRQIIYRVQWGDHVFGFIAFGSATKFLPGRGDLGPLNFGANNTFFHVEPANDGYPCRNFTTRVILHAEQCALRDWPQRYGDPIYWFETLVEMPRTGELYRRAGYAEVGMTKGYTCKRTAGQGSDSWSGKRVWNTIDLRPKRVFTKVVW